MEKQNTLIEPGEPKITTTIGQDFVSWAEQYWRLKEKYEHKQEDSKVESCPYYSVRECFISKIDNLIKDRLSL